MMYEMVRPCVSHGKQHHPKGNCCQVDPSRHSEEREAKDHLVTTVTADHEKLSLVWAEAERIGKDHASWRGHVATSWSYVPAGTKTMTQWMTITTG